MPYAICFFTPVGRWMFHSRRTIFVPHLQICRLGSLDLLRHGGHTSTLPTSLQTFHARRYERRRRFETVGR